MKTKVIFRKYPKDGDIIALFPLDLGDNSPYTCSSYMHVGQHGAADPLMVIQTTKLARPTEYKDLARELTRLGYKLDIIKRNRYSFLTSRQRELKAMREQDTA